jgi:hypothetical protein
LAGHSRIELRAAAIDDRDVGAFIANEARDFERFGRIVNCRPRSVLICVRSHYFWQAAVPTHSHMGGLGTSL